MGEIGTAAADPLDVPRPWVAPLVALGLFLVWSNSFVAVSYLLGGEGAAAQLDWVTLSVSRFSIAGILCGGFCFVWRRREAIEILRRRWGRLLVCGFFAVPVYNLGLYYGQQHGVAPPIASLTTTLVPLFVMVLSALFLGEALTVRGVVGLAVAAAGLYLVATARGAEVDLSYPGLLAITALAPLSWSIVTVISKPLTVVHSPIVWSYMATALGSLMVLPFLPGETSRQLGELDAAGWAALLYLAVPCVVGGFAVWVWLLSRLPASAVGFAVFLNPPLTTLSKWALAALFPLSFAFRIVEREWLGGAVTLTGMAIALGIGRRRRQRVRLSPEEP